MNPGDVPYAHVPLHSGHPKGQGCQRLQIVQPSIGSDEELPFPKLHERCTLLETGASHRADHLLEGKVLGREALRVSDHLHDVLIAAHDCNVGNARQALEFVAQEFLLKAAKGREVLLPCFIHQGIGQHPA